MDEAFADAGKRVPDTRAQRVAPGGIRQGAERPSQGRERPLFYATQTGIRPPRFVVFCNEARRLHFSLRRHLENSLRERFEFGAAPLRLTFRSRRERAAR